MAWQDRDYHRDSGTRPPGGTGAVQSLLSFLNWSFPIGTYAGIRVRVHITFLFAFLYFWDHAGRSSWGAIELGLLFLSVLLHEFGHCFACRVVGGQADDILMWPLGGLAYTAPPRTLWAEFWTTAWGPLTTLILGGLAYVALWGQGVAGLVQLNPLHAADGLRFSNEAMFAAIRRMPDWQWTTVSLLRVFFTINYGLLLFNLLLVFYPFDGGRLVQVGFWKLMGYYRSMMVATMVGMIGAVAVALYGIVAHESLTLPLIAVFGFINCYQQRFYLKQAGPEMESEVQFYSGAGGQSIAPGRSRNQRSWSNRLADRRRRRAQRRVETLEAEVDRILIKVKQNGLQSLTAGEKRTLQRATQRQRSGD